MHLPNIASKRIMSTNEHIGQVIKRLRNEKGLTQEELSRQAGITYTSLVKIETGQVKDPRVNTITKISNALHVSIDKIVPKGNQ